MDTLAEDRSKQTPRNLRPDVPLRPLELMLTREFARLKLSDAEI